MSGRYFDQPSSSPSRSASSSGGSYTDRYRVDNEYPSDVVTASGFGDFESSGSGSLALGSGAVRSSRKNVPTAKLLESLIGEFVIIQALAYWRSIRVQQKKI